LKVTYKAVVIAKMLRAIPACRGDLLQRVTDKNLMRFHEGVV